MSNRIQRVNSLIKNELSQILLKEIDFPKDILVTITWVEVSRNLNQAKVYISVIPKEQFDRIFKVLNKGIYNLQQKLNKRLKMRPIPRIKFVKEEKVVEAARIEELLEEIKNEEKKG